MNVYVHIYVLYIVVCGVESRFRTTITTPLQGYLFREAGGEKLVGILY